jgi:hypothetical protein
MYALTRKTYIQLLRQYLNKHKKKTMDYQDIRKGITNARYNEKSSKILYAEITFIAIIMGMEKQSWWWFGGIFFGLSIALSIRTLAVIIILLLSAGWGTFGYSIGSLFESSGANFVLGALGFFCGLGIHLSALEWTEDITK